MGKRQRELDEKKKLTARDIVPVVRLRPIVVPERLLKKGIQPGTRNEKAADSVSKVRSIAAKYMANLEDVAKAKEKLK